MKKSVDHISETIKSQIWGFIGAACSFKKQIYWLVLLKDCLWGIISNDFGTKESEKDVISATLN